MSQELHCGLVGLGVMGRNLAYNIFDDGIDLSAFSIDADERATVRTEYPSLKVCDSLSQLVAGVDQPRTIFLMVTAGKPVDLVLEQLLPMLDVGDVVIDGGNSHFQDTRRRTEQLSQHGLHLLGLSRDPRLCTHPERRREPENL